jgi:hypothetical protein
MHEESPKHAAKSQAALPKHKVSFAAPAGIIDEWQSARRTVKCMQFVTEPSSKGWIHCSSTIGSRRHSVLEEKQLFERGSEVCPAQPSRQINHHDNSAPSAMTSGVCRRASAASCRAVLAHTPFSFHLGDGVMQLS